MNRNTEGLQAILARLDEVHMSAADRQMARAALEQADAMAEGILALAGLIRRLFGAQPVPVHG